MPDQDYIHISPALERALFLKFAAWLRTLLLISIPIIGGVATLAVLSVQFLTNKRAEDVISRLGDMERISVDKLLTLETDAAKRFADFQLSTIETMAKTKASQSEAEAAAEQAKDAGRSASRTAEGAIRTAEDAKTAANESSAAAVASQVAATEAKTELNQLKAAIGSAPSLTQASIEAAQKAAASVASDPAFRDAIVSRLASFKPKIILGDPGMLRKGTSNVWESKCPAETTAITGVCIAVSGAVALQNIGVSGNQWECVWAGPMPQAEVRATCLQLP